MQLSETIPDTGEIGLIRIAYEADAALYFQGDGAKISSWSIRSENVAANEIVKL